MKIYREEVSPLVDLVLDASRSMFFEEGKALRTWEAFCFCETSARQSAASLHCYSSAGGPPRRIGSGEELAELPPEGSEAELDLTRIPWRHGSLRVVISDLLFAGAPDPLLSALAAGRGRGVVLAPFCPAESAPDWAGNIEIRDCESGRKRLQQVDASLLSRYRQAYSQHFRLWRERAARRGVLLARLPSVPSFREALQAEALPVGAVELA